MPRLPESTSSFDTRICSAAQGLRIGFQMVADCNRHLPALAIIIALQRMVGMFLIGRAAGRGSSQPSHVEGVAAVRPNSDQAQLDGF